MFKKILRMLKRIGKSLGDACENSKFLQEECEYWDREPEDR